MIKSVRLTNFFSFRDCEITLEPDVTVLVGINDSGKTNLLRAFELLNAGMEGQFREKLSEWGSEENLHWKGKGNQVSKRSRLKATFLTPQPHSSFDVAQGLLIYEFSTGAFPAENLISADGQLKFLQANGFDSDWISKK